MARYLVKEDGSRYKFDHASGEWVLIEQASDDAAPSDPEETEE